MVMGKVATTTKAEREKRLSKAKRRSLKVASQQRKKEMAEKEYAEQVRELTRKEMEMAEKEFARARLLWERIKIGVKKTERGEGRCRTSENERERDHREEREKTERDLISFLF